MFAEGGHEPEMACYHRGHAVGLRGIEKWVAEVRLTPDRLMLVSTWIGVCRMLVRTQDIADAWQCWQQNCKFGAPHAFAKVKSLTNFECLDPLSSLTRSRYLHHKTYQQGMLGYIYIYIYIYICVCIYIYIYTYIS